MAMLMATLRPPVTRAAGIRDTATATAVGSLEAWATELVRQLSKLDVSAGGPLVGGVSSVTGGTNITVSPTTGAAVVSLNNSVTLSGTLTLSPMTQGSVLFAGPSGLVSQDNTNLFWDDTNNSLRVVTTTASQALVVRNADAVAGAMSIQNTNVSGPVDFFALDNTGAAKMSWGYGNGSYADAARAGRAYLWRNTGVNFVFARTNLVDGMLFSDGNWNLGTSTTNPNVKLRVEGQTIGTRGTSGAVAADANTVLELEHSTSAFLTFRAPSATRKGILFNNPTASADGAIIYDHPSFARGMQFNAAGTTRFSLSSGGVAAVTGDLTVSGAATLGDAGTDSHTINGRITGSSTSGIVAVDWTHTLTAAASDGYGVLLQLPGTYNCTAATRTTAALYGLNTATRSAGVNNLTNYGVIGSASGGQQNIGVYGSGTQYGVWCEGPGLINGTLSVNGNTTLGDATTDTVTVTGNIGISPDLALRINGIGDANWYFGKDGTNHHIWINGAGSGSRALQVRDSTDSNAVRFSVELLTGNTVVAGTLAVNGNVTLGDASTDTVRVNGPLGLGRAADSNAQVAATQDAARDYGYLSQHTASAKTTNSVGLQFEALGTYDCTAASRRAIGVLGAASATRSSGANDHINMAFFADAHGGQVNYSFYGEQGTLYNIGNGQIDGTFTANGNVNLGNGSADVITINGGPLLRTGTGTPEGAITAPVGSLFLRTDGGASTTLYVKESGAGNTGWVAK